MSLPDKLHIILIILNFSNQVSLILLLLFHCWFDTIILLIATCSFLDIQQEQPIDVKMKLVTD